MPADPSAPPGAIPPPPPSWLRRVALRVRRYDRSGRRWVLLTAAFLVGGIAATAVVTVAGWVLQPRFTTLELAAQRLAPPDPVAQPPRELVDAGAFDRRYVVEFPADPGLLGRVVARARRHGWQRLDPPGGPADAAVLRRQGVRAVVGVSGDVGRVTTTVAPWVRTWQRRARVAAAAVGALSAPATLWWWLRRRPRLRVA